MRAIVALTVSAFLLTACGQAEAPGGMDAPPPADAPATPSAAPAEPVAPVAAPSEFDTDFGARGTEPFWAADIKGGQIKVTGVDRTELVATNAGLAALGDRAVWTAEAGQTAVVVTLIKGECSDGMSDLKYPYAAEVKVGDELLKGCGFRADAPPREGR
ncbi:MAG: hypothetical protein V4466_13855 [Pseudomonadota bacterium]